jgi:hypothetical protein
MTAGVILNHNLSMEARSKMKRVALMVCLSGLMALTMACAGSLKTFPVQGRETELAKMRGDWKGEYTSPATGRTGTIHFNLEFGRDIAEGEVQMNIPGQPTPRTLKIDVMRVQGSELHGKLARYVDPACNCAVETVFVGALNGNIIEGTFTTTPVGKDSSVGGTWRAERYSL